MKKRLLLIVVLLLSVTILVGCEKKEKNEEGQESKWKTNVTEAKPVLSEEVQTAFDAAAKSYNAGELSPVALLAKQVVSGTNYMLLVTEKTDGGKSYEVAVVYKDLEGKAVVNYINNIPVENYANFDNKLSKDVLAGGWTVEIPEQAFTLDSSVQTVFDQAVKNQSKINYYPITTLAMDNDDYVVLCYGKEVKDGNTGIFVLTLDKKNKEIKTSYAVDLKEFNK